MTHIKGRSGGAIQRGTKSRAGHDPRAAALRVLDQVRNGNESSQSALDAMLTEASLAPSDAGLCTELSYGCLRYAILLDWWLNRLLKKPEKLPTEMRLILSLACYELAFLDKVPGYAAVHGAVSRIRNRFGGPLSSVANGTLRSFQRALRDFHDPAFYERELGDEWKALSLRHGLPDWIAELWRDAYGEETARALIAASAARPVAGLRVNALAPDASETKNRLAGEQNGLAVGFMGLALPGGVPPYLRRTEREGRISFQSPAVMELLGELDQETVQPPVWDACAGRGGKTLALLERGIAVAAASDSSEARIRGLEAELTRLEQMGSFPGGRPDVVQADARTAPFPGPFATILADVPCSGLGTLARRPEIRLRRNKEDIDTFAALQKEILDAAALRLVAGGRIIYVTCTCTPQENQDQIRDFLARHEGFSLESEWSAPADSPWREFLYRATVRKAG